MNAALARLEPVEVLLAWPHKDLNPNSRAHFMAQARAKKNAKEEAFWATKVVLPRSYVHDGSPLNLNIVACPPDKRPRDQDNAIASLKPHIDGIAQAIGCNDRLFDLSFKWGEVFPSGRVLIEVSP